MQCTCNDSPHGGDWSEWGSYSNEAMLQEFYRGRQWKMDPTADTITKSSTCWLEKLHGAELAQCVEDLTTNGRQALPDAPRAAGKLFSHNVSSNWLLHVGAARGKGHTACACTLGTILELRLAPELYRQFCLALSRELSRTT